MTVWPHCWIHCKYISGKSGESPRTSVGLNEINEKRNMYNYDQWIEYQINLYNMSDY